MCGRFHIVFFPESKEFFCHPSVAELDLSRRRRQQRVRIEFERVFMFNDLIFSLIFTFRNHEFGFRSQLPWLVPIDWHVPPQLILELIQVLLVNRPAKSPNFKEDFVKKTFYFLYLVLGHPFSTIRPAAAPAASPVMKSVGCMRVAA